MKRYKVAFRPMAEADLLDLYDYIAGEAGTQTSLVTVTVPPNITAAGPEAGR